MMHTQGTAEPVIAVKVPITNLYWTAYTDFFKRRGCKIERTTDKDGLNNCELVRIVFPAGTRKQRLQVEEPIPHFKLILPDGTEIEERQAGGPFYSFLYAFGERQGKPGAK